MSDVNLTLQDNGGVYLAITETPAVVTLGAAVISGALASTVTVSNVVSVSVVTMPSITVTPAAVTTVAGTVSISNFPASSSVTIANFPSVTTVTGTVALDQASLIALENVTVTVGSTVSISNLPATQTIAGTVTANVFGVDVGGNTFQIPVEVDGNSTSDTFIPIGFNSDGDARQVSLNYPLPVNVNDVQSVFRIYDGDGSIFGLDRSFPINGTVGVDSLPPIVGTVTANLSSTNLNSVTIGVRGTVTANIGNSITVGSLPVQLSTTTIGGTARLNVTLSSATTVGATAPSYGNLSGGSDGTNLRAILTDTSGRTVVTGSTSILGTSSVTFTSVSIGSCVTHGVTIANTSVTISGVDILSPTTPKILSLSSLDEVFSNNNSGSVLITKICSSNGNPINPISNSELRASPVTIGGSVTVSNSVTIGSLPAISGTVTASVINSVTVGAFPQLTWTDYSGTIATAGMAVTAISTITRSYLLAQVTTGQIFINIGATATTLNSVYFSAGQGFAWETSVPQGIVSIISSVTGTNYVLKDG